MAALLLDTSVFLRFFAIDDPISEAVRHFVAGSMRAGDRFCFTPQVVRESWSVVTRPKNVGGLGLPPETAMNLVQGGQTTFEFLADTPAIYERWIHLVANHGVSGRQVHDAYHVAAVLAHNLSGIVTLDARDFRRYNIPVHLL